MEKKFFQTLASLKTKDPRIYDEKTVFFAKDVAQKKREEGQIKKRKTTEKKLTLGDLERKIMLEKVDDHFHTNVAFFLFLRIVHFFCGFCYASMT